MSKAHLTALAPVLLFLRWLATGHVALTVGGLTAAVAITRTEALRIARQARRYGHWSDRNDPRAVPVDCPRCRQRVRAVRESRRAGRGPLYQSPGRAQDRAMLAHLTEGWCKP